MNEMDAVLINAVTNIYGLHCSDRKMAMKTMRCSVRRTAIVFAYRTYIHMYIVYGTTLLVRVHEHAHRLRLEFIRLSHKRRQSLQESDLFLVSYLNFIPAAHDTTTIL